MNDEQKKTYVAWLNDAHALEESLITMLEKQIGETNDKPLMQDKLRQHLEQTRRHAELMRTCLTAQGEEPSGGKDFLAKAGAVLSGTGMSMADDAMVKNVHSSYAAEHAEIATYTLIRAAAEEFGDTATVNACDEILVDEINMADWLLAQIPEVTIAHLRTKI